MYENELSKKIIVAGKNHDDNQVKEKAFDLISQGYTNLKISEVLGITYNEVKSLRTSYINKNKEDL